MIRKTMILAALFCAACTPAQLQQANQYQADIATACGVAMSLLNSPVGSIAGTASGVGPWIVGGCATEQAIAKLALDPSSLAWVSGLIAKVKAA